MDKRIIIIHPSQIVRQGVIALIRGRIDWSYIDCSGLDELAPYRSIRNSRIVFVVDPQLVKNGSAAELEGFRETNSIKTLHLALDENNDPSDATGDFFISINASKEQFLSRLDHLIGSVGNLVPKKGQESMSLTDRECDILKLVALGKSNKEMAHMLSISIHTVITHRKNITDKLNIKSISGLTVYAILNRLLDAENIDVESLI